MSAAVFLSGTPATPVLPLTGVATIVQNTQAIAVVDAKITASSVVVCALGLDNAALATQPGHSVCLQPGVGFTIRTTAIATNPGSGLLVNWAVLKY
jgi:hypothetical protein